MITMKNIVLVGFMGTGKTTVGLHLEKRTGFPLVDMDQLIEQEAGTSIRQIFAEQGEAHFRSLERSMAQKLAVRTNHIISTGGGIVLNPDNLTDFASNGLVVCLTASPDTILNRVRNDQTRPLLAGDKEQQIRDLLQQRQPLYDAISFQVATDQRTPEQIADSILKQYRSLTA
jgi:shikimate kinase